MAKAKENTLSKRSVLIGLKLREIRSERGLSQSELADSIGVSFQQVQKYEKGVNRISADRLFDVARILNAKISDFFGNVEAKTPKAFRLAEADVSSLNPDSHISKESSLLLKEYFKLPDSERKKVVEYIMSLAKEAKN